jgi:flagellar hook protein FlgE
MSSSIYTSVSGIQAAQEMLDVVGNNLANLNTTGFKSESASFADLVYQTLAQATGGAVNSVGGTNPTQIGLGTFLAGTNTNEQQGALQQTGNNLDLAIEGNGYFEMSNGNGTYYTRDGAFGIDSNGFLVDPTTGYKVQRFGTVGEATATSPAFQSAANSNIQIPYGTGIPGTATQNVTVQGNLSAATATAGTYSTSIQIFDSQGTGHSLSLTFTKTGTNAYSLAGTLSDGGTVTVPANTSITFNADGSLAGPATVALSVAYPASIGVTTPQTVTLNLGTVNGTNGLTQFGGDSSAAAIKQDGSASGTLTSVSIAQDGIVNGSFSNGEILPIAQIALAQFANPAGLSKQGNNYLAATVNSGPPIIGGPESGGAGQIQAGTLEQSNVDVSTEFTNLVIAQQAFEVNAKAVTTSAEVLTDLANIIR